MHGASRRSSSGTAHRSAFIGWSLGGVYARELARTFPHAVRQLITLGSPFRFRSGDRGFGSRLYDTIGPRRDPLAARLPEEKRPPLPVPSTSIYTRTDGVVRSHACLEAAGPRRENIEVYGTHTGLAVNVAALVAVTDRLAQPAGEWELFRPPLPLRHLFPRPRRGDPVAGRS